MRKLLVAVLAAGVLLALAASPAVAGRRHKPQGSAGVSTTCNSIRFNFTGAGPGVKQSAKVDGVTRRPKHRNGSVTFTGLEPGEHPVSYRSGTNRQTGSFEALACSN